MAKRIFFGHKTLVLLIKAYPLHKVKLHALLSHTTKKQPYLNAAYNDVAYNKARNGEPRSLNETILVTTIPYECKNYLTGSGKSNVDFHV